MQPQASTNGRRVTFAKATAALSALIGLAAGLGWALNLPAWRALVPGAVEMKANSAVAIVAAALALALATGPGKSARRLADGLCAFVLLLGAATLGQYAFGWQLGIDELLVRDTGAAFNQIKGRMSPYTAAGCMLLGTAILGVTHERLRGLARLAAPLAAAIGVISMLGYAWNATEIVTDRIAPPVALNTAFALTLLGLGALVLAAPTLPEPATRRAWSRLETLVLGGFVPLAIFLIVGGGITYESAAGFDAATERVAHTQEVRAALGQLRAALADAETAQHSLTLTDDASYAAIVASKAAQVRRHLQALVALTADNPEQQARQKALSVQVERRLEALNALGDVQRTQGSAAARNALIDELRRGQANEVQSLIESMDATEGALLKVRLQRAQARRVLSLSSLLATFALVAALSALLLKAIRRETIERAGAQASMENLNLGLEERIAERTSELSHQQDFLRRVIDLDRNLIFAKDCEGRFVLANQALADALGTRVDDLIGRAESHSGSGPLGGLDTTTAHVIDSGEALSIPKEQFVDAHGHVRWLATVKRPILSPDGLSVIALGVCVDITDRIAAEDRIRELNVDLERRVEERTRDLLLANVMLQRARIDSESASRSKSAFLANMSHEIRTPMNAVIGLTHLMRREATDARQRERLGKVGDAAHHLLRVINDILDMSKIEAGKMTLERVEFSIDEVLSNAISMVNGAAREKRLELILDPDHLPARLVGDPTRLSQILINLLSNAVKFTEHGWVRLRGELLRDELDQVEVRFEVQDTGPGIALDRQSSLFGAFEQVDASISRRHGGTGLGLALSRELARAMGGDAGVTSAPGSGSTFWFTAVLGRGAQAAPHGTPVVTAGLRALLVDDLRESLSVIGDLLQLLGLEVDPLASGPAAIARVEAEMAARRPYDVMVIDWRMAPMDGIETLTRLRQLLGDGTPPAILITAFDDASLGELARAAGYGAVLIKPVTHSSLQEVLATLLGDSRAVQRSATVMDASEAQLRAAHTGQRVLLAEDNPVNREVAESLLGAVGLIIETAGDGARAVELATSRHYDLAMLDIQMPIMDGLEAAREIRLRCGKAMPIIAMTANAFAEDRAASIAAGMNDHVAKPVDPAQLYATLLRWLPLQPAPQAVGSNKADAARPAGDLREQLQGLPEIDLEAALRHVAGQPAALARVLHRFAATYAHGLPALVDDSGTPADRQRRWRGACHSIRGAVAAIGATALLDSITRLEQRLGGPEPPTDTRAERQSIDDEVRRLVQRVDRQLAA